MYNNIIFNEKKIGITGSTGFLGANFLVNLLKTKEFNNIVEIRAFYSSTRWNPLLLDIDSKKINYQKLDILDYNKCLELTKDLDCIIHFAAVVSFSKKDREKLWKINVEGTENILNAAINNKVKKFILISSVSILDRNSKSIMITEEDIGINDEVNGVIKNKVNKSYKYHSFESKEEIIKFHQMFKNKDLSFLNKIKLPYHDTKLASYIIAKEIAKGKEIEFITILPGTVLGKGDNHYSITKLVDKIYKNSLPFALPGIASFVHVEDLSNGILLAMSKGKNGEDYIISGNKENNIPYRYFMKEIAKKLKNLTKKRIFSNFITLPYFITSIFASFLEFINKNSSITSEIVRSGYSKAIISIEKSEKELGYEVKKNVIDAVNDICEDFIERDISNYEINKKYFMIIRDVICSNWVKKNGKVILNYDNEIENCRRKVYIVHHPTTYDFFTLSHLAKNNFYLAINRAPFDVPVVGYFLSKAGFLPVYRNKEKNSYIIEKMIKRAKNGYPILNSARNEELAVGVKGRLRTGGVVIADLSKADLIPLHIYIEKDKITNYNTYTIQLKKAPVTNFKNALVFVSFLKPLKWEEYHKDNMTKEDYTEVIEKIGNIFDNEDEKIEKSLIENKSYYDTLKRKGGSDIFINY